MRKRFDCMALMIGLCGIVGSVIIVAVILYAVDFLIRNVGWN